MSRLSLFAFGLLKAVLLLSGLSVSRGLSVPTVSPTVIGYIALEFDELNDADYIGDFYLLNYGISFGPYAQVIRERHLGGTGSFAGEPTPPNAMSFKDHSAVMNIPRKIRFF